MSNKHSPETHSPETEDAPFDWEKHLRWLAPVTAGILIVATAFMWVQTKNENLRTEVMQAYTMASTADELTTLAEAYPGEPEAPLARLQAGAMLYDEGEFEQAQTQYTLFLEQFPSHPMKDNAQWGIWMTQEALGDLDAALAGFRSIEQADLLYPQALLGQARILEKQQDAGAARKIYTEVQAEFPQSSWAEQAKVFSERLGFSAAAE